MKRWNDFKTVPGITIYGPDVAHRGGIVTFRIDGIHPEDLAAMLDQQDVFTRHGHHCTMPLHTHLGVSATTRVSLAAYNTVDDITALMNAIEFAFRKLTRRENASIPVPHDHGPMAAVPERSETTPGA